MKDFRDKKLHLIGITGVGMTAIAQLLQNLGARVSGSDTSEDFFTVEILKKLGIPIKRNFSGDNAAKAEIIISSNAYLTPDSDNPEIREARKRALPILSYPEILAMFFRESFGIAVAGSHGKSTTSAMLAVTLERAGLDPAAVIGTKVLNWGTNARQGGEKSKIFVAEADEYKEAFLKYSARAAIVTNIDWDHPDHFPTALVYNRAFKKFAAKLPANGFLVIFGDSDIARETARSAKAKVIFYGQGRDNNYTIKSYRSDRAGVVFTAEKEGNDLGEFKTRLIGRHNALNSLASVAAALEMGADLEKIREGISAFQGTARRFERMGEREGILIYDDYAHHPSEIKFTLDAVREAFRDKKIWAIFQPHTYSRTEALLDDFGGSFAAADNVVILDIYSSARERQGKINSRDLVENIKRRGLNVFHKKDVARAVSFLKEKIVSGDLVLTMGAGDVWKVGRDLLV